MRWVYSDMQGAWCSRTEGGPRPPWLHRSDVLERPYTAGGGGGNPPPPPGPPPPPLLPFQCLRLTAKFCFGAFGAKRIEASKISAHLRRGPYGNPGRRGGGAAKPPPPPLQIPSPPFLIHPPPRAVRLSPPPRHDPIGIGIIVCDRS